jgi:hypothetical protein
MKESTAAGRPSLLVVQCNVRESALEWCGESIMEHTEATAKMLQRVEGSQGKARNKARGRKSGSPGFELGGRILEASWREKPFDAGRKGMDGKQDPARTCVTRAWA